MIGWLGADAPYKWIEISGSRNIQTGKLQLSDIFVARQPIFDAKRRMMAYELLYRGSADADTADGVAAPGRSSSIIVDAVLGIGLDTMTGGRTAFINFSERMLLDGLAEVLNPETVVLEILEDTRPTKAVVGICRDLVEKGFRIALDDFTFDTEYAPMLELAEIVKIDVKDTAGRIDELLQSLRPFDVRLLAEKVETEDVHAACVDRGFDLFQGFHYFKPETISKTNMSSASVAIIRLLNVLKDVNATDRTVEEAFKSDPSLTYRLLRIANSAGLGGRGIVSITHALQLIGRDPLHRWMCLLLMNLGLSKGDMSLEMIKDAILRGRMCELAGDLARNTTRRDIPSGGSLFLVGLFSHIDQLMGLPMETVIAEVDLTPEVRTALLERKGKAGAILTGVEAYTNADWNGAQKDLADLGVPPEALADLYIDALTWAASRMPVN